MFNINYSIIKVNIEFLFDGKLNKNKQSSIRGVLGNTLIKKHCLSRSENKDCSICVYREKCIVKNIFNARLKKEVKFIPKGEITPFIVICDDHKEIIKKGDIITFSMIFFGDTACYIPTVIETFCDCGKTIGLEKNRFKVNSVFNDEEEMIFNGKVINPSKINTKLVSDYINNRLTISDEITKMSILNPIRFKRDKIYQKDIQESDLINLIKRRIVTLCALEGKEVEIENFGQFEFGQKNIKWSDYNRYSNRQKARMSLGGVTGEIKIQNIDDSAKKFLIAGELLHIGKNSSFGLGDYILY